MESPGLADRDMDRLLLPHSTMCCQLALQLAEPLDKADRYGRCRISGASLCVIFFLCRFMDGTYHRHNIVVEE